MRSRCSPTPLIASLVVVAAAVSALGAATLLSARFEYKADVVLEVGRVVDDAVRLDTVRFRAPRAPSGRVARTSGFHAADVALSNVSGESVRVGVAIALYDADDRLLGVASGGSGVKPIKADRQKSIRVVFDDVNAFAADAASFQISVELRP